MRSNQRAGTEAACRAKLALAAGALLLLTFAVSPAWAASSTPIENMVVPNGNVYAVAIANGKAYLGGAFTQLGTYSGGCVLVNSAGGTASGFPKVAGRVSAVLADGFGGWYIGGDFASAGGVPRNNIAHVKPNWDIDPNWNPNADGEIRALALSGNTLYVGGAFANIGGQARNCIAGLDTASGNATDWDPHANSMVNALAVSGNTVYAGGTFTNVGGQARNCIAALDATVNSNNATPWDPNADNWVYTLVVSASGSTVYAGGGFTNIGGQARNYIAALDSGVNTNNATAWNPNASSQVWALVLTGTTLYAGGLFTTIGGQTRNYIAALVTIVDTNNATPWNPQADGLVRALALSGNGNTVYAGGSFLNIGGRARAHAAALDATSPAGSADANWNPQPNGGVITLGLSGTDICIGGSFSGAGGVLRKHLAQFDLATGNITEWDPSADQTVTALCVSGNTVYVGGRFFNVGGQARQRIAALDAGTGTATGWAPNANDEVDALCVSGNTVYAGGSFTQIGGQNRNYIAALDATVNTNNATGWNPSANDWVQSLAVSGSTVYAGGWFTQIGGAPRIGIAALDATVDINNATLWNPQANNLVWALTVSGNTIYAGGAFTQIGGQPRSYIAALDSSLNTSNATNWNPGADNWVYTLALSGNTVFAGGDFANIGGKPRMRLAALEADVDTNNATTWDPSADILIWSVAASNDTVCVGGQATAIGAIPRAYFAAFPNHAPSAADCTLALDEDSGPASGTLVGSDEDNDPLRYSIAYGAGQYGNSATGAKGTVTIDDATTGAFTYIPNPFAYGTDTFSFRAYDGMAYSAPATLTVTINFVNHQPTLDAIPDQNVPENGPTQTVGLSNISSGAPTEQQVLTVSAVSDNLALIPSITVNYTSPNTTATISYTPAHDAFGTANITVSVTDDGGTDRGGINTISRTFLVTVDFVNNPPTLDEVPNKTVNEDSGPQTIALTGITSGAANENQALTVTAVSDNTDLMPNPTITYTSPNNTGGLEFKPNWYKSGAVTITVTVKDDGSTAGGGQDTFSRTFTVNVSPVPHALLAPGQDLTTNEDTALPITLSLLYPHPGATVAYSIVIQPAHGVVSGSGDSFVYIPDQDYNGFDSFSFKASDGSQDSDVATVTINVKPVADAGLISISPTQTTVNGPGFVLTVTGSNFAGNSVVTWGGKGLGTTFVSAAQLTAAVTAAELALPGVVPVAVYTPNPGGGTSNAANFYVYSGASVGSWIVTNTNDDGPGSLRQAMSAVRAGETISFDQGVFDLTASDAATTINVKSALPPLDKGNVTIDAQDRRVTVNGSAAGSTDGLAITSDGNSILGLTVLGFTGSGISIQNGQNNILGGNRLIGAGPNGQGLRVSSNGTYGIQIKGPKATGNLVKGCWLGLSASGREMHPNLAGLLLEGGANGNTIGSTVDGERNAVSGNYYEGITVSGTGTDNNAIVGNIIGAAAVSWSSTGRAASRGESSLLSVVQMPLGNGSAGVFLSKGTKNTKVGGPASSDGNLIAYNGGNGVEVHTTDSMYNSANSNMISENIKGGIQLSDGSNGGITAPTATAVQRLPSQAAANAAGVATVALSGAASVSSGFVEVFTDPGKQGKTLVAHAPVANGMWMAQVDVNATQNITATVTDTHGNTSQFAFMGTVPPDVSAKADANGNGIPNYLETLAGLDPNAAQNQATMGGAVMADRLNVSLNFASRTKAKDAVRAGLRLVLPAGYLNEGTTVALQFADYIERFAPLDAKGKSPGKGNTSLRLLGASTVPGAATGGLLMFSVRNEDLKANWTSCGMTDKTTVGRSGETLTVPVAVALGTADGNKYVYAGNVSVAYKAVKGKLGRAEKKRK